MLPECFGEEAVVPFHAPLLKERADLTTEMIACTAISWTAECYALKNGLSNPTYRAAIALTAEDLLV